MNLAESDKLRPALIIDLTVENGIKNNGTYLYIL